MEAKFWERFDKQLDEKLPGVLDKWFGDTVEKYRKPGTGRTGRTTLPGIFYDAIFGKAESRD